MIISSDWTPMSISEGPPLPRKFQIFWPWVSSVPATGFSLKMINYPDTWPIGYWSFNLGSISFDEGIKEFLPPTPLVLKKSIQNPTYPVTDSFVFKGTLPEQGAQILIWAKPDEFTQGFMVTPGVVMPGKAYQFDCQTQELSII